MNEETKLFWASLDFLNSARQDRLQRFFGNLENAQKNLTPEHLLQAGISQRSVSAFWKKYTAFNFDRIQKQFEKSEAQLIHFDDAEFPEILRHIPDPPLFLFVKGQIFPEDTVALAVVGTRKPTLQGKQAVSAFVPELSRAGFTIVSGMARGVDAEAHTEALHSGGRTLAVWGTGIDVLYPQEHGALAREIIQQGAIISEFPLGTTPDPYNFPRRNRLISGLAVGTLVIEGAEKSGSLITALLALEQGKEVFAVPGSPFSALAAGPNRLIQRGEAKLVTGTADILTEFPFLQKTETVRNFVPENEMERLIFMTLTKEPMPFDELVQKTQKPGFEISSALMLMGLKGMVRDLGMNTWARSY